MLCFETLLAFSSNQTEAVCSVIAAFLDGSLLPIAGKITDETRQTCVLL